MHPSESSPNLLEPDRWKPWMKAALLCALVWLVYGFGVTRGFIFDDNRYILEDQLIKRDGAWSAFWFSTKALNYYPLFWSLLRVQWLLWGDHACGYHAVNLLVHTFNALLVWRVVSLWKIPGAWWVGVLFAVHPVNVQTVAWAAEQKNTWSFFFMAVALWAFIRHMERGSWRAYAGALLAFFAALACKTSVAGLPLFLLLCYGVRRGIAGALLRLTPFFLLSLGAGITTIWFEKHSVHASSHLATLGLWQRIECAGAVFWAYLGKALVPVGLTPLYRGWTAETAAAHTVFPLLCLGGMAVVLACLWRRMGAAVALGLAYYFLLLLPLLGIFDTNYFEYSLLADHWQYHALPGLLVAGAALWSRYAEWIPTLALWLRKGALLILVGVASLASRHFSHFEDERTLWTYVVSLNPEAWAAWYNLGCEYSKIGAHHTAAAAFNAALRYKPNYYRLQYCFANALLLSGQPEQAEKVFLKAEAHPRVTADAFSNRGVALHLLGRDDEAISEWEQTLRLEPNKSVARQNLVIVLLQHARYEKAGALLTPELLSDPANCRQINLLLQKVRPAADSGDADPFLQFTKRALELSHGRVAVESVH